MFANFASGFVRALKIFKIHLTVFAANKNPASNGLAWLDSEQGGWLLG